MSIWLWVVIFSNILYWSLFFFLVTRRKRDIPAFVFGILHMLFASLLVAAPFRSLLDPDYMGYQLGIIRFEGQWAFLPATAFLAWALSSAWIAVARGRGSWMKLIAVGDILFALNLASGFFIDLVRGELATSKIQGGEFFTLQGPVAALIPLLVFAVPFMASAVWAARRSDSGNPTAPFEKTTGECQSQSNDSNKGIDGARFAANTL
jgi:hypothetical protein